MPGSVTYKYTIQKCDRMDEDANSPSESNWQFYAVIFSIFSNNWQLNKLKNNPCLSNWQGLIKFYDSLIIAGRHSNFLKKIWQSRLSTQC